MTVLSNTAMRQHKVDMTMAEVKALQKDAVPTWIGSAVTRKGTRHDNLFDWLGLEKPGKQKAAVPVKNRPAARKR